MRYKYLAFILFSVALLSCSNKDASSGKPILAVSIDPQKAILDELVGDRFDVITILSQGANPETFEPSVSQRMQADKALAFFTTGYLPFEQTLARSMDKVQVVNTSAGIQPMMGTHTHTHHHEGCDHGDADPHVWTSLRNGKTIAMNMSQALADIDPDNATEYKERAAAICARLDSLDAAAAKQLADANVHAFAVWHPSLSYYARDYGLHQISVGQESKEVSIGTLRGIIEEAKEDSVRVFFFQKEYDSRQANNVNNEIGSRFVTINPLAYDWENELMMITNELAK